MTNRKQVIVTSVVLLLSLIILYPGTTLAQEVVPEYVVTIRFHSYYLETDDIPILSFEYSEQNTAAGSVKKSSMVEMADILVTRLVDENSPKLFVECAKGTLLDEAFISIWYPGSMDAYPDVQVWLKQVSISSYSVIGESGSDSPKEGFTLGYQEIRYLVKDSTGAYVTKGWNLLKNQQI